MSKKHFIALADVLRDLKPPPHNGVQGTINSGERFQWERTLDALARFCSCQNGRFNRSRWIDYINGECGPNGGKVK